LPCRRYRAAKLRSVVVTVGLITTVTSTISKHLTHIIAAAKGIL